MGSLDLENELEHKRKIKKALKKRGLRFDPNDDWEIHGPHQGMNYQVYVGTAYDDLNGSQEMWIAIYPHAVYEIEDSDEWYKTDSSRRIFIK